jgi:hypothetical protein
MLTRRLVLARVLAATLAQLALPAALAALSFTSPSRAQGAPAKPEESRPAPAKPRVEIIVLYATKDPGGGAKGPATAPRLGPGVPKLGQLSQPPFNAYSAFTFVGQTTLTLDVPKPGDPWKGKPSATYPLVTGKQLQIALLDQLPDKRFHMGATIGTDAPDVLRWDAPGNEPVFVAGQSYKDGILVIGITLRAP